MNAPNPKPAANDVAEACIKITDALGLHLRAASALVHLVNQFEARIEVQNLSCETPTVDARSILRLMQLRARPGHSLRVRAQGSDAAQAVAAIEALFEAA